MERAARDETVARLERMLDEREGEVRRLSEQLGALKARNANGGGESAGGAKAAGGDEEVEVASA